MSVGVSPARGRSRAVGGATRALPGRTRLTLLNAFELSCSGRIVPLPFSAARVVAFLALQAHPSLRPHVAGTLWPETPEERAAANLRSSLWRLRRTGYPLVEAGTMSLRLHPRVLVDVDELLAAVKLVGEGGVSWQDPAVEPLLAPAELLPGWYDDWVLVERERLRQLHLHALEALSEELASRGDSRPAVEAGLAAVCAEPLRESAHRVLIQAYLAEGNRAEAVRQYRLYRRLVHDELGLEPTIQMERLVRGLPR